MNFVKELKKSTVSLSEKLDIARKLINSSIYIPNKSSFLFDFLIQTLLSKYSSSSSTISNRILWTEFHTLCLKLSNSSELEHISTLNPSVVGIFVKGIQSFNSGLGSTPLESNTGEVGEKVSCQDTDFFYILLDTFNIFNQQTPDTLRASFDTLLNLYQELLLLVLNFQQLPRKEEELLEKISLTTTHVILLLMKSIGQSSNMKKIFNSFIQKGFKETLNCIAELKLHPLISKIPIEDLLRAILFNKELLTEFQSYFLIGSLDSNNDSQQKSYVKLFFTTLSDIHSPKINTRSLKSLSIVFKIFLQEVSYAKSLKDSEAFQFAMYAFLTNHIKKCIQYFPSEGKELLSCLVEITKCCKESKVFHLVNTDESRAQLAYLKSQHTFLKGLSSNSSLIGHIFDLYVELIGIEYTVIDGDLFFILTQIIQNKIASSDGLLCTLIRVYCKSRQFDELLTNLLECYKKSSAEVKLSPIVLDTYVSCIKDLNSQIIWHILEIFKEDLISHMKTSFDPMSKKRKLNDGSISHQPFRFAATLLEITLLKAEITDGLSPKIDKLCDELYVDFILPTLSTEEASFDRIIPSLELYLAMVKCSINFHDTKMSKKNIASIFELLPKTNDRDVIILETRIILYHIDRLLSFSNEQEDFVYAQEHIKQVWDNFSLYKEGLVPEISLHLFNISRVSKKEDIEEFIFFLLSSESGSISSNCLDALLETTDFYEVRTIRDIFLRCSFRVIRKEMGIADDHIFSNYLTFQNDDIIPLVSILKERSFVCPRIPGRLISLLNTFPIEYWTSAEKSVLCYFLLACDIIMNTSDVISYTKSDICTTRVALSRLMMSRESKLVSFKDQQLLLYFSKWDNNSDEFRNSTICIYELIIKKKMTTEDQKDILELYKLLASLYQWEHITKLLGIVKQVPVSGLAFKLLKKCDALVHKAIENNDTSSSVMKCAESLIALKLHANQDMSEKIMQVYNMIELKTTTSFTECFNIIFTYMNFGTPITDSKFKEWIAMFIDIFGEMTDCETPIKILLSILTVEQYSILLSTWIYQVHNLRVNGLQYAKCLFLILTNTNIKGSKAVIKKNLYKIIDVLALFCYGKDGELILISLKVFSQLLTSQSGQITNSDALVLILNSISSLHTNACSFYEVSRLIISMLKYQREHVGEIMHLIVCILQNWIPAIMSSKTSEPATQFSRILETLSQKPTNTETDILATFNLRPFAKHLVHLVVHFTLLRISTEIDVIAAMKGGMFVILDILNDHERKYMLDHIGYVKGSGIGRDTARHMIKDLYVEWTKTHKFAGKV